MMNGKFPVQKTHFDHPNVALGSHFVDRVLRNNLAATFGRDIISQPKTTSPNQQSLSPWCNIENLSKFLFISCCNAYQALSTTGVHQQLTVAHGFLPFDVMKLIQDDWACQHTTNYTSIDSR